MKHFLFCFLTWSRGSTLIHPHLYGYMLQSPTSTRTEGAGISPLRAAASSPCECALQSCQRFTLTSQIPQLPQKQHNKESFVTSQRDLLLIFWKVLHPGKSCKGHEEICSCAYKLHHREQEERPQQCIEIPSWGHFQVLSLLKVNLNYTGLWTPTSISTCTIHNIDCS